MTRRRRLVSLLAAVSLATLGGAFWVVYVANSRAQEHQLDVALLREAREEAREIARAGGDELMISDRPGPNANDVGPLTKYAVIYGRQGQRLATTATFRSGTPSFLQVQSKGYARPFDLRVPREHLRGVLVPIPESGGSTLLLAAPRTDLDGDEAFLARAMLLVFGVAFAWVVVVSGWVVRRFTRGHDTIAAVARRVAAGDLDARIPFASGHDEVTQLAQDVNHMIARLSALLSSHQAFVAHAAHELRSPLTMLYGELSHALRRPRDTAEYCAAIEEALQATKRLITLSEELLTLARLSEDDARPLEPVDVAAALGAAQRWIEPEALGRQIALVVSGQAGIVRGRPGELERVLRNLLENAVRHGPQGRAVRVHLELGAEQVVRVANEGSIAPAERDRIFEPFVRGTYATVEGRPGVGLGLAIARQLAVKLHGTLELAAYDPELGMVEFVLRLPTASGPNGTVSRTADGSLRASA